MLGLNVSISLTWLCSNAICESASGDADMRRTGYCHASACRRHGMIEHLMQTQIIKN